MSLIDKKSLYDRNYLGIEGEPVGQNPPQDGGYFTDGGTVDSPFFNKEGDHLVSLLKDHIVGSFNSGLTYDPAVMEGYYPGPPAGDQDFDGVDNGQGIFTIGPLQGKQVGGKDLHEHLLENYYKYSHGGKTTALLVENERGHEGGAFDLDGRDGGNGFFHGIDSPGRFQGKQIGGKDLHEHLLENKTVFNTPGTGESYTVGPSPGPSGYSDFQDLGTEISPFDTRTNNPPTYKDKMVGTGAII